MNKFTDEQKREFLTMLANKTYPHGDDRYVTKTKKGAWVIGYSNDYPLQHGPGESVILPDKFVDVLMNEVKTNDR